jgi:hypothetical protein
LPKKKSGCGYGLLSKQEVQIAPWEEVAIDMTPPTGNTIFKVALLLKPWNVKVNGQQVEFNALLCIDKASKLVKLISNNT